MSYTVSHWQLYAQNLSQHTIVDSFHQSDNLVPDLIPDLASHRRQPDYPNLQQQSLQPNRQLPPSLVINHQPHLGFSIKRCLALMPLLLLPYTTTTQALTATTAQVIHGNLPYFTFNNGVTKITPATNTSTASNPIVLPELEQSFSDIIMLVPINNNSIPISTFLGLPYNYWGDGDGKGIDGITATGDLSIRITNNINKTE